jgi:HD-GYP domain-containing protein (c-di-GMP phosphodiesterase class II)
MLSVLQTMKLRAELRELQQQLQQRKHEVQQLHRIGIALSSEKDLDALQDLILRTSREMTSADAGTLYLVREHADKDKTLTFQYAQNDSISAPYQHQQMPINTSSIAGFVASTGQTLCIPDVYQLPPDLEYSFNPAFDQTFGYRTRSLLAVPMQNREGVTVGVIQLINRKRHFDLLLHDRSTIEQEVIPFTEDDEDLLSSFAGQAAIALENKMLLDNIQHLFDGFVHALVTAMEARDPTTFGHASRVAKLSAGLARTINDVHTGRWKDVNFTPEQLRELEYACLLHDFGKVGVREHVLIKPKKLYDWKLQEIRARFRLARQLIANQYLHRRLDLILAEGQERYTQQGPLLDSEEEAALANLEEALRVVLQANEPSVLEEERFQQLVQVASQTVQARDGQVIPLVTDEELNSLSIQRGTLDEEERREFEAHVTHSFNFLIQIPWTRDLQGIPNIVYAHHEKLDGSGYPRQLRADEIPIQAKIMAIADIFDALTTADRPYKPAVPLSRALDILCREAKGGGIDPELVDLFIRREVYCTVMPDLPIVRPTALIP